MSGEHRQAGNGQAEQAGGEVTGRPEWFGSPSCPCPACTDDEERGCAYVYKSEGGLVQCGLPGGHDGSCDAFETPHEGNWKGLDSDG